MPSIFSRPLPSMMAVIFCAISCSGCQSLSPVAHAQKNINQTAEQSDAFNCSGKLFIRYNIQGKPQQFPGRFDWSQQKDKLEIQIYSPVGQTIARVTEQPEQASLEQPGKPAIVSANLDQLLEEVLRYPLPASGMKGWLQGKIKNADGQFILLNPEDQSLEQSGWKLRFASWYAAGKPKRIDISGYTEQAGEVIIQIVLEAED